MQKRRGKWRKLNIMENEPQIVELYKGKIIVKFYPKSHQYWVSKNGEPFKRATGTTTYIGIKDKSRPLSIWQQGITADYLLKIFDSGGKITRDNILEAVVQNEVLKEEAADIGKE